MITKWECYRCREWVKEEVRRVCAKCRAIGRANMTLVPSPTPEAESEPKESSDV